MADIRQLNRLKQGVEAWNVWRRSNLSTVDLRGADLSTVDLSTVDLRGADLSGANLYGATLREADLREATLSGATLYGANLSGANLKATNLYRADLSTADLSGAHVLYTVFGNLDLRHVKGLESVIHVGPSTVGTDTLMRSEGAIPALFLKGAGVSDGLIEYAKSLVGRATTYYTCFISYDSQDHAFAERLHNDLQGKGVRCWFAPEDLKTGDVFWKRIDESIKLYDKLLVILSAHSVKSDWVEREVHAALEKEGREKRQVLFPIRLDETVKQTDIPWAADMRRRRHITDFTGWETDYALYQNSLQRVLRDLQSQDTFTSK